MKRIMEERNIDRLYHFTQASNLKSILEHGIMPKDDLDYLGIVSRCNDEYRFDSCTNLVRVPVSNELRWFFPRPCSLAMIESLFTSFRLRLFEKDVF